MSDFKVTGTVKTVMDTQQVSDKFRKRDLILTTMDNPDYPQDLPIQFTQDNVDKLDSLKAGDEATVSFNLRGREWTTPEGEVKYFGTIEGWRVEKTLTESTPLVTPNQSFEKEEVSDSLPF